MYQFQREKPVGQVGENKVETKIMISDRDFRGSVKYFVLSYKQTIQLKRG